MAAGNYALKIEQGATFRRTVTWTDANGNPISLSGYSARLQIRESPSSATTEVSLTSDPDGGLTITEPNIIEILITDEQTADISIARGVYDLEVESPGGEVTRLLKGYVFISPEVTR